MFKNIERFSIELTKYCNFNCVYCHQSHSDESLSKVGLFDRVDFINNLDISSDSSLDICFTGGEVTACNKILEEYLEYVNYNTKISNKKFTIMSNMSNVTLILNLLDRGLIAKDRVGFSWDGINNSVTRCNEFNNEYFVEALNGIASSRYKDDIFIQISLHPNCIANLSESVKILKDIGITNLGTYLITGEKYSHSDVVEYDKQMEIVSNIFMDSYINDVVKLRFFTFNKCFRDYIIRKDESIEETTKCKKLGNAIHIGMNGHLYPCIYFGDHDLFRIGSISSGLDNIAIDRFIEEYSKKPECINDCKIKHCLSCPAVCYGIRGGLNNRNNTFCNMFEVEKKWFFRVINYLKPYITDSALSRYWGRVNEPA